MKYLEFINQLEKNKNLEVTWKLQGEQLIPDHYHITEVKVINAHSVDCGGNEHHEKHYEIQLWTGSGKDDGHRLTADKTLKIFDTVGKKQGTEPRIDVFIEYGNKKNPTRKYMIKSLDKSDYSLIANLEIPQTACKPALALADGCCTSESACC